MPQDAGLSEFPEEQALQDHQVGLVWEERSVVIGKREELTIKQEKYMPLI
jgi:hypothetical protein